MSRACQTDSHGSTCTVESLRVLALLGVFVAQLYLSSRIAHKPVDYCFTRPFWLDEIHTWALIQQDRIDQLLSKLSLGGDCSPPGLHIALWVISKVTGASDELLLRSFSCTVGIAGLVATYSLLRAHFPGRVCWVAVLGMWSSSPQLIQQMFEGRPYSFWFASVAVFCLLLSVRAQGVWKLLGIATLAALMCLIHYFGIIALGLMAVSQIWCNFRDRAQRRNVQAAIVGGMIGLAASLPICLQQRAWVPRESWIPLPTVFSSFGFIQEYLLSYAMVFPVVAYAVHALSGRTCGGGSSRDPLEFRNYAAVCGLILLPVALVVFSYAVQPALITRYAVPASLAYAPLIALISHKLNRSLLNGMAICFFLVGLRGTLVVYEMRPDFQEVAPLVKASTPHRPLIVHRRAFAYPLFHYSGCSPEVIRISFLFRGATLSRFDHWEQVVARRMAELFDMPKPIEREELASLDEFFLLVAGGEEARYVGWTAEPLSLFVGPLRAYRMNRK